MTAKTFHFPSSPRRAERDILAETFLGERYV
jgi:hypothetical protein